MGRQAVSRPRQTDSLSYCMHKFVRNLITEWRRLGLPIKGETVVVAVSGGADSTALQLALADLKDRKKLDLKFIAAHFNHKLRGRESDEDERFVKALAKTCGLSFVRAAGDLNGSSNLEERARIVRYDFLAGTAQKRKARFVLTAHTINDQAETFLLNLIRGSGPDGLAAMGTVREITSDVSSKSAIRNPKSQISLVRPMLRWAQREETEAYCRARGVEFRVDRMNDDRSFNRVRIRKDVLPLLAELNPNIVKTLARTSELIRARPLRTAHSSSENHDEITVSNAKKLEKPALYSLLRSWLREKRGNLRGLQLKHIEAIERLVNSPKSGRIVELPGGGQVVKRSGRLAFRNIKLEN